MEPVKPGPLKFGEVHVESNCQYNCRIGISLLNVNCNPGQPLCICVYLRIFKSHLVCRYFIVLPWQVNFCLPKSRHCQITNFKNVHCSACFACAATLVRAKISMFGGRQLCLWHLEERHLETVTSKSMKHLWFVEKLSQTNFIGQCSYLAVAVWTISGTTSSSIEIQTCCLLELSIHHPGATQLIGFFTLPAQKGARVFLNAPSTTKSKPATSCCVLSIQFPSFCT